jgi:hypothetical protein
MSRTPLQNDINIFDMHRMKSILNNPNPANQTPVDMYTANVAKELGKDGLIEASKVVSPTSQKVKNIFGDALDGSTDAIKSGLKDGLEKGTVDFAKNKVKDAVYGTPAEQAVEAMDTMFPNTDGYERLGAGSGGASAMTTAERVARINTKSAQKVASIGQTTGALAKAQVANLKQRNRTEKSISKQEAWKANNMSQILKAQTSLGTKGRNINFQTSGKIPYLKMPFDFQYSTNQQQALTQGITPTN